MNAIRDKLVLNKNIKLEVPVVLAPMAGITDLPYRILCKEAGCGFTVSEMVSAKGLLYKNQKTFGMLAIDPLERPTAIQLFGRVPSELAAAAKIVEASGADVIDFNMGCPVQKVAGNGEGSALMKEPELAYEILARMVEAVDIPVTVKFRSGWSLNSLNAPEIARQAERAGVAMVAVHGRTREQFYAGTADWQVIKAVKDSVTIPVIGNGDIFTVDDASRMLEETGCDGVMVGRGAHGNPWIFTQLRALFMGEEIPEMPGYVERFAMIDRHLQMLIEFKGPVVALKEMRQHVNAYVKGLPHAAGYRCRFNQMNTYEDFHNLLNEYGELLSKEP